MKKLLLCIIYVLIACSTTHARAETQQVVGKWRNHAGFVKLSVMRDGEDFERAIVFVSDKHVIDTVYLSITKDQLEDMRDLINETLEQMK